MAVMDSWAESSRGEAAMPVVHVHLVRLPVPRAEKKTKCVGHGPGPAPAARETSRNEQRLEPDARGFYEYPTTHIDPSSRLPRPHSALAPTLEGRHRVVRRTAPGLRHCHSLALQRDPRPRVRVFRRRG